MGTFDRKGRDSLIWLDLETTGSQDEDLIIEIGIARTDLAMNVLEEKNFILPIPYDNLKTLPDVVREMHTVNGLLDDCAAVKWPEGVDNVNDARSRMLSEIDLELSDWVKSFNGTHHALLAGSGISHFDRKYVQRDLPLFEKRLAYINMDIGTARRWLELAGVQLTVGHMSGDKTHRALDDAKEHAMEAKRFLDWARWQNE